MKNEQFYSSDMIDEIRGITSVDKLRILLKEVETEIKYMIGEEPLRFFLDNRKNIKELDDLETLVGLRCFILNRMFKATPDEVKRFEEINALLDGLTKKMYHRTASFYRSLLASCRDESFDDDYNVEGSLSCNLDYIKDEQNEDVLCLENDEYYGSDFAYMMSLVWYLEDELHGDFGRNIEECSIRHEASNTPNMTNEEWDCYDSLDDGVSWAEGSLCIKELEHICMCHAIHSICTHHEYSIPDLLRMNNFWVEAKITCQHGINQSGKRYNEW